MEAGDVTNAERILNTLDGLLTSPVELTLYGKAALLLGFENTPAEFGYSRDVDAVLWMGQAEELDRSTNFWDALEQLNDDLGEDGLYMTHLFEEDQVILRPNWRDERAEIQLDLKRLRLYRLGNVDLLLSKLMRDDPVDFADVQFIVREARLSEDDIRQALARARVPDDPDITEQLGKARTRLLEWLPGASAQ